MKKKIKPSLVQHRKSIQIMEDRKMSKERMLWSSFGIAIMAISASLGSINVHAENPDKSVQVQNVDEADELPDKALDLRDKWTKEVSAADERYIKGLEALKKQYEIKKDTESVEQISDEIERVNPDLKELGTFPEGTIKYKGHHYFLIKDNLDFEQAEAKCKELGGDLLSITDKTKLNFFLKLVSKDKVKTWYWLKAIDIDKDSKIIQLLNIKNKPLKYGLNPIVYSGSFDYHSGSGKAMFICEWDK